jgi:hypothetical protein
MPRRRRNAAKSGTTASKAKTGKPRRVRRSSAAVQLEALVSRYVGDLVAAINQHMRGNMAAEVRAFIAANGGTPGRVTRRGRPPGSRKKRVLTCIAPGCTNPSKGPRFHYLCAKHMNAPKRDYEAWRLKAKAARRA